MRDIWFYRAGLEAVEVAVPLWSMGLESMLHGGFFRELNISASVMQLLLWLCAGFVL